jgi:hypothetical protein
VSDIIQGVQFSWTTVEGTPRILAFDVATSRSPSTEISVTDYPVETGGNITDHARALPSTIEIEGAFTDNPKDGGYPGRAQALYSQLEALALNGTILTILTARTVTPSVLITRLSTKEDVSTGDSVEASVTCKQVRFVSTSKMLLKSRGTGAGPGKRQTSIKGTLAPANTVDKTLAHKVLNFAADAVGVRF